MPIARRRHPVAAAIAAALALAGAGCGDDGDRAGAGERRAEQARRLAAEAGLDDDVGELLALAAAAVDQAFVVTYELGGDDEGTVVTVTSSPPERRVDVTAVEPGSDRPVTRSVLSREDGTWSCRKGAERWFCDRAGDEPPDLAGFAEADVARTVAALRRAGDDVRLAVEERELAGVAARCLVSRPAGSGADAATATLCVSPEGVPLLVDRPAGTLRATAYSTEVPDGALELPAEPG